MTSSTTDHVEIDALVEDDFIDEAEAARIRRISSRTSRQLRAEGEGPPWIRSGRTVLFRRSSVLAHLAAQERPADQMVGFDGDFPHAA